MFKVINSKTGEIVKLNDKNKTLLEFNSEIKAYKVCIKLNRETFQRKRINKYKVIKMPNLDKIFTYHSPIEAQIISMKEILEAAKKLAVIIESECPSSADRTSAIRHIRVAVMEANASIVLNGLGYW